MFGNKQERKKEHQPFWDKEAKHEEEERQLSQKYEGLKNQKVGTIEKERTRKTNS